MAEKEEKKINRRTYLKYVAGGAVAVAAAAGGYYLYQQPPSPTTTATSAAVKTSAAVTTPLPEMMLVWNNHEEEELRKAYVDASKAFTASTGVRVESLSIPGMDFHAKFASGVAAKALPDIITPDPAMIKAYIAKGSFEPLDDVIDEIGWDKFYESPMQDFAYEGKHYGVNLFNGVYGLVYRKDHFAEAGVSVPTNWDELLEAAKALTKGKDRYGFGTASGTHLIADWFSYTFMRTNKADIFDESGNVIFNSPETVETFEFLRELYKYAPAETKAWSWSDQKRGIWSGLCSMAFYQPISVLKDTLQYAEPGVASQIGGAPTPKHTEDYRFLEETGLCAPKGGQSGNLQLTKALIKEYSKPENALLFSSRGAPIDYLPATKPVQEMKEYWSDPNIGPHQDLFRSTIALQEHGGAFARGSTYATPVLGAHILANCLQKVVYTKATVASIVTEYEAEIKKVIS